MTSFFDEFLQGFVLFGHRDLFWILADLSHMLAIAILFYKIIRTKSVSGISGKTQILYLIVFVTRYMDLLTGFIGTFNYTAKLILIVCSLITTYLIFVHFRETYNREYDTFLTEILIVPCIILALVINHELSWQEILWTFSIYLEAVTILPQLILVRKMGRTEYMTSYLIALGSYRALYVIHWFLKYELWNSYDWIAIISGLVQTIIFMAFFCIGSKPTKKINSLDYTSGSLIYSINQDDMFSFNQNIKSDKKFSEKMSASSDDLYCKLNIYREPSEAQETPGK